MTIHLEDKTTQQPRKFTNDATLINMLMQNKKNMESLSRDTCLNNAFVPRSRYIRNRRTIDE